MFVTYTQPIKEEVRYKVLSYAVEAMTSKRDSSTCVRSDYVSGVKRYLCNDCFRSGCAEEAAKVSPEAISEWRRLREACVGSRRPEELKVCYLAGPEPLNDFRVLIELGIRPENIWAFESDKRMLKEAVNQLKGRSGYVPRLIGVPIQSFFTACPVSFDIVYYDACGSIISGKQKALSAVAALFRYQRMNSPSVLITNFSSPDFSDAAELNAYADLMARKKLTETGCAQGLDIDSDWARQEYAVLRKEIELFPEDHYSNFITSVLCSIPSVTAPAARLVNSDLLGALLRERLDGDTFEMEQKGLNGWRGDSFLCFLESDTILGDQRCLQKQYALENCLVGGSNQTYKIRQSLKIVDLLRHFELALNDDVLCSSRALESSFQFLDKPSRELYSELALRQMSYPLHPVCDKSLRFSYIAKKRRMFTDVVVLDDCRYIYDWLPLSPQAEDAIRDEQKLYIFRFALDGLIKQRMAYGANYFFGGSVVGKGVPGFGTKDYPARKRIS